MWSNPGELLKMWREQVAVDPSTGKGLSPRSVEERCREINANQAPTHMTIRSWEAWETKKAVPPTFHEGLGVLDAAYQADGALEGLALSTPKTFAPRWVWAHNFNPRPDPTSPGLPQSPTRTAATQGPRTLPFVADRVARHNPFGERVWAWLRPGPGAGGVIDATVRWGVFEARVQRVTGDGGVFLTCRVSTPHPAAFITYNNSPGWVNFGSGRIPDALGVDTVAEVDVMSFAEASQSLIRLMRTAWGQLAKEGGLERPTSRLQGLLMRNLLAPGPADPRRDATSATRVASPDPWAGPFDGPAYKRLREAIGMTRSYVCQLAFISERQLEYFEAGNLTSVEYLASRLDRVYGADGFTCRERVREVQPTDTGSKVIFPAHWVGPVVLTLRGPGGDAETAEVDLRWGSWRSPLLVRNGLGVSCRCDTPGGDLLFVDHTSEWKLRVEMGYNPDAVDINGDNWDVAPGGGADLIRRNRPIYVRLFQLAASKGDESDAQPAS